MFVIQVPVNELTTELQHSRRSTRGKLVVFPAAGTTVKHVWPTRVEKSVRCSIADINHINVSKFIKPEFTQHSGSTDDPQGTFKDMFLLHVVACCLAIASHNSVSQWAQEIISDDPKGPSSCVSWKCLYHIRTVVTLTLQLHTYYIHLSEIQTVCFDLYFKSCLWSLWPRRSHLIVNRSHDHNMAGPLPGPQLLALKKKKKINKWKCIQSDFRYLCFL